MQYIVTGYFTTLAVNEIPIRAVSRLSAAVGEVEVGALNDFQR